MKEFTVQFIFSSTRADGDGYTMNVTVKAKDATSAANMAWFERVHHFGARADNALDCRTIETKETEK